MVGPKKKKILIEDTSAEDLVLGQLSQAFLENLKNLPNDNSEDFEKYSDIIRVHFYSHLPEFEKRFVEGYHLIMKEISSET